MAFWGSSSINRDDSNATAFRSLYLQGSNPDVGVLFESIQPLDGLYQGVFAPGPGPLRVAAGGHVDDNQAGSGLHAVTLCGLLDDGTERDEDIKTHATDGTLAGPFGSVDFARLNVSFAPDGESGTHFVSNKGVTLIENATGHVFGAFIATRGTSQIAWYTVPKGYECIVVHVTLSTNGKEVNAILCHKNNHSGTFSASVAQPSGVRTMDNWDGVTGIDRKYPTGVGTREGTPLQPLTDIFFSCQAVGPAAKVTGSFGIMLRQAQG